MLVEILLIIALRGILWVFSQDFKLSRVSVLLGISPWENFYGIVTCAVTQGEVTFLKFAFFV